MTKKHELRALLAERELARRNLLSYVKYIFKYYYERPFIENWHHSYICEVLQAAYAGEVKRIIINLPPSYTKSELAVRQFGSWSLGRDPSRQIIYATYGDDLSTLMSVETRNIVESAAYKQIFGTKLNQAQNQKFHWATQQGGRFFSTSTTATITGVHANLIVMDDPMKAMEAHSKAKREEVVQFYKSSIVSRLRDKKNGVIIIIAQRLHPEDLVGTLLDENPDGWMVVKLRGIAEEREHYSFGGFEYTREKGEALFRAYEDEEQLQLTRLEMGDVNFKTQYQQDPEISEAGFFEPERWHWIDDFDIPEQSRYILIDPAMSQKKESDLRAILAQGWSIDERERELVVNYDCDYGIWSMAEFVDHIIAMMMMYPDAAVLMEAAGGGLLIEQALRKEVTVRNAQLADRGMPTIINPISVFTPNRNITKNQRIMAMQTYYNTGQMKYRRTGRGMEQLKTEMFAFRPEIAHNKDNCIDAKSMGFVLRGSMVSAKQKNDVNRKKVRQKRTWRL